MPLTDTEVRNAKPGAKPRKIADGDWLFLVVSPNGSKLWRMGYRFAGKESVMSLGSYPTVSLAEARRKRDDAKALIASGQNPNQKKRLDKIKLATSAADTFAVVAEEMLAEKAHAGGKESTGAAPATLAKNRWLLSLALPTIGHRPIADLTRQEILDVLRKVEASERLHSAHRLRSVIGEVFRHAMENGARASADHAFGLGKKLKAHRSEHRAAITDDKALGGLLRAIDGFDGQPTTRAALQLMALLFPRPGELRFAEWKEFDLEAATWSIPAARTKTRKPHVAPLPLQAVAVLEGLRPLTGRGALVFPGYGKGGNAGDFKPRPISENTMNAALRRLGFTKEEMTSHGFRATASSLLNESGQFSADAIERALAHQGDDDVRRAYNRGAFWEERVRMAQWWADHLDALRAGRLQGVAILKAG
ncbi:MAG: integrase [Rhodobacter sp.]|nr:integrase [Rhodobacter sp.]